MVIRKIAKIYPAIAVVLIILSITQLSVDHHVVNDVHNVLRNMLEDKSSVEDKIKSYSSPGSIAAIVNTAEMGTDGVHKMFMHSWLCHYAQPIEFLGVTDCKDDRRVIQTHMFDPGSKEIQRHRKAHPEGECLIVTTLRSPASWFASWHLHSAGTEWRSKKVMLQDYRKFVSAGEFDMLYKVLPDLLSEFNAGTLIKQTEIMDHNGGYSLIPAPSESALVGCDLLFLRMEGSDQWPNIFQKLDPDILDAGEINQIEQHHVKAISALELTSDEKINIFNSEGEFLQDWFNSYRYMDDVISNSGKLSVEDKIKSYSSPGSIAAIMNTAEMGTGALYKTFKHSWLCHYAQPIEFLGVTDCKDDRRVIQTHMFDPGSKEIQRHRKAHPEGECLIVTTLRSPASWFASWHLHSTEMERKSKEELLQDYRLFLASGEFDMLYKVLPDLLSEFNAGTLIKQAEIMDHNGGYSLIPAPSESALAGCDLLFLRMEGSDQWPNIFQMFDPNIQSEVLSNRLKRDHPKNTDQLNAILGYELTSDEKINIFNSEEDFLQDWFDSYKYMGSSPIDSMITNW